MSDVAIMQGRLGVDRKSLVDAALTALSRKTRDERKAHADFIQSHTFLENTDGNAPDPPDCDKLHFGFVSDLLNLRVRTVNGVATGPPAQSKVPGMLSRLPSLSRTPK